jgi:hypothetical protein
MRSTVDASVDAADEASAAVAASVPLRSSRRFTSWCP